MLFLFQLAQSNYHDPFKVVWDAWSAPIAISGFLLFLAHFVISVIYKSKDLSNENETKRADTSEALSKTLIIDANNKDARILELTNRIENCVNEKNDLEARCSKLEKLKVDELFSCVNRKKDLEDLIDEKDLTIQFLNKQLERMMEVKQRVK